MNLTLASFIEGEFDLLIAKKGYKMTVCVVFGEETDASIGDESTWRKPVSGKQWNLWPCRP